MRITDITAPPGGVMTVEVGVITGDLTLKTEQEGPDVIVRAQYKDAAEWYTLAKIPKADPLDMLHTLAVKILNRPE